MTYLDDFWYVFDGFRSENVYLAVKEWWRLVEFINFFCDLSFLTFFDGHVVFYYGNVMTWLEIILRGIRETYRYFYKESLLLRDWKMVQVVLL